jgi:hypothetical protein
MHKTSRILVALALAVAVGIPPAVLSAHATGPDSGHLAVGAGRYVAAGTFDVRFSFAAITNDAGRAVGAFHGRTEDASGSIEFIARVTCLTVDIANGRAWIGGLIVANRSSSPAFQQEIHQPGHDIWFRVVDNKGLTDDRSTFLGFEGVIPSSAEYCATQPWPADDARTWAVTSGHIIVR